MGELGVGSKERGPCLGALEGVSACSIFGYGGLSGI